jgi:hypothetical protein
VEFVGLAITLRLRYGLLGVAWAQVAASLLVVAINMSTFFRTLQLRVLTFVARKFRIFIASAIIGYCVVEFGAWLSALRPMTQLGQLVLMVLVGGASYGLSLYLLWRLFG